MIETLVSMNDKLAQANNTANENQKNSVISNANQAIQEQRMQNILKRIPDANACEESLQQQEVEGRQDQTQAQLKLL